MIIFSRKTLRRYHPCVMFNNKVNLNGTHEHLRMISDLNLNSEKHVKSVLSKISKTIGLLQKFQGILPGTKSLIIYKSLARTHLDYDIILYKFK